jgi:CubicO group peptidase (beta-lactamase class C family)
MGKVSQLVALCAYFCASVAASGLQSDARGTSPVKVPNAAVSQHIERITSCIRQPVAVKDDPHPCTPLSEVMARFHIPGVSIAVIHNGSIEWARGFGMREVDGKKAVDAETLFQAGSISKPVAALAALHLVQMGKLSLDADVNTELTTWKLPSNPAANGKQVTLRELLTHTGGTTVHGFPGYAAKAPVPTLVQVLNGEPPANTPAIRIESEPGNKWNYSGGGYTIMQQMLLDASHEPFPQLLHDMVLAPIGMTHSTYQQPLPDVQRSDAAAPYDGKGGAIPGGAHTYPEMAAAGLWTTPSDLAKYAIEIERSLEGNANHVLSKDMTQQMLTPGKGSFGLGVQIGGPPSDPYFSHGGVNEGFESLFVAYRNHGDGAVVMTNAQGGSLLADYVMRSIAMEYGWPDYRQVVRTQVKVDRATLARYVGTYQLAPDFSMAVTLEGDQLITQLTDQDKVPIFPESPTEFFTKVVAADIEFLSNGKGEVTAMVLHQNGRDIKGVKQ